MEMSSKKKDLLIETLKWILTIILFIALYFLYRYYIVNNFNEFLKCEENLYTSKFIRDANEKYSAKSSYKIESNEFNDAMFYKKVKVDKNQNYKVTCMVKTENVEPKDGKAGVGAQISIEGSSEKSKSIIGTQEWQKIEMIFNSKKREEVNIGFRLGGNLGDAKGNAWFSDFTLEKGTVDNDNEWKMACFIFDETDVVIDGNNIKFKVTNSDVQDIKDTYKRFEKTCYEMSKGKMKANCDLYQDNFKVTKLSYDDKYGYYVAPEDVEEQIKKCIKDAEYDHIFVVVKLRRWK